MLLINLGRDYYLKLVKSEWFHTSANLPSLFRGIDFYPYHYGRKIDHVEATSASSCSESPISRRWQPTVHEARNKIREDAGAILCTGAHADV